MCRRRWGQDSCDRQPSSWPPVAARARTAARVGAAVVVVSGGSEARARYACAGGSDGDRSSCDRQLGQPSSWPAAAERASAGSGRRRGLAARGATLDRDGSSAVSTVCKEREEGHDPRGRGRAGDGARRAEA